MLSGFLVGFRFVKISLRLVVWLRAPCCLLSDRSRTLRWRHAGFTQGSGVLICTPHLSYFFVLQRATGVFARRAARSPSPCEATFGFGVGFLAFGFFFKISTAQP